MQSDAQKAYEAADDSVAVLERMIRESHGHQATVMRTNDVPVLNPSHSMHFEDLYYNTSSDNEKYEAVILKNKMAFADALCSKWNATVMKNAMGLREDAQKTYVGRLEMMVSDLIFKSGYTEACGEGPGYMGIALKRTVRDLRGSLSAYRIGPG